MEEALARIYALGGMTQPAGPDPGSEVRYLRLSNTDTTDADLRLLPAIKGLQYVRLDGTQVTADGLTVLTAIPTLTTIDLRGLNVNESDLVDLRGLGTLKSVAPFTQDILQAWLVPDSERTFTEWVTSDDGDLSLRLMAPKAPIPADEPIVLFAELRNNTDESINVLRPFGDAYVAWWSLEITGPDGRLSYTGSTPDSGLGSEAIVALPPGRSIRDRIELSADSFAGINKPGQYTIVYPYILGSHYAQMPWDFDWWKGEIRSEPITIEKR